MDILGVEVDLDDLREVVARISSWLDSPEGGLRHIVTVNPEYVIAARRYRKFRETLNQANLALADGVGILLAARLLRNSAPSRITGNDLVDMLAALPHPAKRLFLLGAAEGVASAAAQVLSSRYRDASIVGTFSGDPDQASWPEIERRIIESRPTVLFVAFGHPRQDLWIAAYRDRLEAHGILIASGVGGVFDYLSGRTPRAPAFMRRLGLEWLFRLIRQPWRWRRQTALPVFLLLVMVDAVRSLRPFRSSQ